jgi:hypothetical protein
MGRILVFQVQTMKRNLSTLLLVLTAMTILAPVVLAQGDYALTRSVIAGGDGVCDTQGTVGQPAAGAIAGGDYELSSGFWGWLESIFTV